MTLTRRSLWLAQLMHPQTSYVIAFSVDLTGPLDISRLHRTVDEVLRHVGWHDVHIPPHLSPADPDCVDPVRAAHSGQPPIIGLDFGDHPDPDTASRLRAEHFVDSPDGADLTKPLWASELHVLSDLRHRWVVRLHHALTDGAGALRIMRHIGEVYAGNSGSDDLRVPSPADLQTADTHYLDSARYRSDERFWSDTLDLHQPSFLSGAPVEATSDLTRITRRLDVPRPPTTAEILAAFAGLCARLLDTADVGLSLPVATRTTHLRRQALAPLSNVVPMSLPGIGDRTAEGAVEDIGTAVTRTLRHQLFHREDMLRRRDDIAGFGAVANLLPAFDPPTDTGLHWSVEVMRTGPTGDVTMTLHPDDPTGGRAVSWEAPSRSLGRDALEALSSRFNGYLGAFLTEIDTGRTVPDDAVFLDGEWARSASRSGPPAPEFTPTAALLDEVCTDDPGAPALIDGQMTLSRTQLRAWADHAARRLISAGVAPGDPVAVCIPRSAASVVAFWAVLRAGAVWVPVGDPFSPRSRTRDILQRTGINVGLSSRAARASTLPEDAVEWLDLDLATDIPARTTSPLDSAEITPSAHHPPGLDRGPDDRAYILFTSGSTGTPKGVDMPHRGIPSLVAEIREHYALTPASRMMHASAPTFDTGLVELLSAVSTGAALVIAPMSIRGGDEMTELIRRHDITHIIVTPSVLDTLSPDLADQLVQVVLGGEPVTSGLVARWGDRVSLRNAYGPTETRCSINFSGLVPGRPVTVGAPMTGVTEAILDRRGRPQPPDALGVLHCSGPQVADGYLDAPELTAEAFSGCTFSDDPVMYCTGDLATWTDDGEVRVLGRRDGQIKLRGLRIELGEVNAALTRSTSVRQCATVMRDMPSGRKALVSYVVPADHDAALDPTALRHEVAAIVPSYMVPSIIVPVEALPHTANDKLDTRALAALPLPDRRGARRARDDGEELLMRAVAEALTLDTVDPDASFLDHGGDSLAVMAAARLMAAAGHPEVTANDLLVGESLAAVASAMTSGRPPTAAAHDSPQSQMDRRRETTPETPLSAAQRTVSREPGDPCAQLIRLAWLPTSGSAPSPTEIRRAVQSLVDRHPSLRSTFPDTPSGPIRRVAHSLSADAVVSVHPVEHTPDREILRTWARRMSGHLDVRSGPPIALTVLTTPDGHTAAVILVLHHIAVDGHSLAVLAAGMAESLSASASASATVAATPVAAPVAPDILTPDGEQFWRDLLLAEPESAWTLAGIKPAEVNPGSPQRRSHTIPLEVARRFRADAAAAGVTGFEAFESAAANALHDVTGDSRVVSATPTSRRPADASEVVDDFILSTIIPLAVHREAGEGARLSRRCVEAATVPMEDILDLIGRPASAQRLFPVPVMLGWSDAPADLHAAGSVHVFGPDKTRWLLQIEGTSLASGALTVAVTGVAGGLGHRRIEQILTAVVEQISRPR
ncbi:amino acid adenylation domain-containing protein [Gordonia sp. NPDC003504]